uniref:Uncharacterized protein n=1 Tax=Candidatus Kentrum sp. LPFa TaxID=2126335 RepID=A0A450XQZ1_9GAMM|nr:MAG: hypothetical protein BECKLPF1236A_GA0070988_101311 [Candidatus Kentron sp. LPFa]VFK31704.1 MAG: hypothetical protein BECKLPF1236C_GA0070990_101471 [Candidatus Kentron sp. LPFa]
MKSGPPSNGRTLKISWNKPLVGQEGWALFARALEVGLLVWMISFMVWGAVAELEIVKEVTMSTAGLVVVVLLGVGVGVDAGALVGLVTALVTGMVIGTITGTLEEITKVKEKIRKIRRNAIAKVEEKVEAGVAAVTEKAKAKVKAAEATLIIVAVLGGVLIALALILIGEVAVKEAVVTTAVVGVMVAGMLAIVVTVAGVGLALGAFLVRLVVEGTIDYAALAAIVIATAVAKFFLLFVVISLIVGIWLRSLIVRVAATLRHPLRGIHELSNNWQRILWVIDSRHIPELVPDISARDESFTLSGLIKGICAQDKVLCLLGVPIIPLWFMLGFLYRWSLKSTCWLYLPLICLGAGCHVSRGHRRPSHKRCDQSNTGGNGLV